MATQERGDGKGTELGQKGDDVDATEVHVAAPGRFRVVRARRRMVIGLFDGVRRTWEKWTGRRAHHRAAAERSSGGER